MLIRDLKYATVGTNRNIYEGAKYAPSSLFHLYYKILPYNPLHMELHYNLCLERPGLFECGVLLFELRKQARVHLVGGGVRHHHHCLARLSNNMIKS